MKKFLIGMVTGLVLAAFTALILFFALVRLGDQRPSVSDGSTLVLNLQGDIPEKPEVEFPFPGVSSPSPTMQETWSSLRQAASDSRIKALILMPRRLSMGWAKVQEIRDDLVEFKKSGKPVYAWLETPSTREYYLATAADKVYLGPEDFLDVKGLRAEMMFFRNTLNKVGVEVEVEHVGKYKDAGDMFSRTSMSPETREVMDSVLDRIYSDILGTVAAGRKKPVEEVRAAIDNGPFLSADALRRGLIDGVVYKDQVYGELKKRLNQGEIKRISYKDYVKAAPAGGDVKNKIAFLVGQGAILRGESQDLNDDGIYSDSFIRVVRQAANDASVKGVILRIDSPGGDAIASDDILREVKLLSQKKPTVVSMSDLAASGGYYIAMTGDPIVAYPGTFTGSIGVIYGKPNLRGLYDKFGIQKEILKRGENADLDSDYGPMSDKARKKLRESLESIYSGFVKHVAEGRKRTYEEIDQLAQGRVWLGAQARENHLIDELGGLNRAVEMVKVKARIPAGERVRLVPFPGRKSFFETLMHSSGSVVQSRASAIFAGTPLEPVARRVWRPEFEALLRGGTLRLMPYFIDIR